MQPAFKTYTAQVLKNAAPLAENMADTGYLTVSGGTTNHLFV